MGHLSRYYNVLSCVTERSPGLYQWIELYIMKHFVKSQSLSLSRHCQLFNILIQWSKKSSQSQIYFVIRKIRPQCSGKSISCRSIYGFFLGQKYGTLLIHHINTKSFLDTIWSEVMKSRLQDLAKMCAASFREWWTCRNVTDEKPATKVLMSLISDPTRERSWVGELI
jgi:hypothetical protein